MLILAMSAGRHLAEGVWGGVCGISLIAFLIIWGATDIDEGGVLVVGGIVVAWAVVAAMIS